MKQATLVTCIRAVIVVVNTDTTAPDAPVITDPTDGATLTSPITSISGTAEANSTVEVFDNGNTLSYYRC